MNKINFFNKFLIALVLSIYSSVPVFAAGYVDSISIHNIIGWACDTRFPENTVDVHVWRDDGKFLGGGTAKINRENAVAHACNSSHSAHGFAFSLDSHISLHDGNNHKIKIYLIGANGFTQELSNSPATIKYPNGPTPSPTLVGEIVGRDLNIPLMSWAGHLGMWDGNMVIEALNNHKGSTVQKNSWHSFYTASTPWKTAKPNYGSHDIMMCSSRHCQEIRSSSPLNMYGFSVGKEKSSIRWAMVKRANQIIAIGSDYTHTIEMIRALPSVSHYDDTLFPIINRNYPPRRGAYRCDTLIVDLLLITTQSQGYYPGEGGRWDSGFLALSRVMMPINQSWAEKINKIEHMIVLTPLTLINAIHKL